MDLSEEDKLVIWRVARSGLGSYQQIAQYAGYTLDQVREAMEEYKKDEPLPKPPKSKPRPIRQYIPKSGFPDVKRWSEASVVSEIRRLCLVAHRKIEPYRSRELACIFINFEVAPGEQEAILEYLQRKEPKNG